MSNPTQNVFEVIWRIKNARHWFESRNDTLYSPQFLVGTLMNTRWKFRLTPKWQLAEKYISLSLQRDLEDDYPRPIDLNYDLFFMASDGSASKIKRCTGKFDPKTVSQEVNVKLSVILDEEEDVYFSKGVLTVCCQMWKGSTISIGKRFLLRSEIGKKCMHSNATIDVEIPASSVIVNFMPTSEDISLISLEVSASHNELKFKTKHVDCKSVCWYSYELFASSPTRVPMRFQETDDLTKRPDVSSLSKQHSDYSNYFLNNTLSLQLKITYYPGIVSEDTESLMAIPDHNRILQCGIPKDVVESDTSE